jgi:signal transduction histidine kinase
MEQTTQPNNPITLLGAVTDRRLAALRLVLSLAAMLIIYLIPPEPDGNLVATYYALAAYAGYSLIVFAASRSRMELSRKTLYILTFVDLSWYTLLTSLSNNTNNLFFFFYLFAIIVASSRVGAQFGLLVTVLSALLCVGVCLLTPPMGDLDMTRVTLRPFSIMALGYILSYWGGAEVALKKKMTLLNELSLVANPRFGVAWTIELILRRLLGFWNASYCVLLLVRDNDLELYLVSSDDPNRCQKVPVQSQAEVPFIDVSDSSALVYNDSPRWWTVRKSYRSYDSRTGAVATRPLPPGEALAEFLSARSFVSVPLRYRERSRGRIVVSSARADTFNITDAAFLQQVANQALPVIENIRLVENLASDASEMERNRIARSVHDRVIQPYYGLQIGLKALHSVLDKGQNGSTVPAGNGKSPVALLSELMSMTADGIDELRQYVSGLKESRSGDTRLADSIRRFAAKFENATGIHVKVQDNTEGLAGNDRLTSEMFQMAAEALSNVHRHTEARSARVSLKLDGNMIRLQVENECGIQKPPANFTPRSICDRAEALGGRTEVQVEEDRTIVRIDVPL